MPTIQQAPACRLGALIASGAAALLFSFVAAASAAPNQRADVVLDGSGWQTVTVTAPADPNQIPDSGWDSATAPWTAFVMPDGGPHYLWFERTISIPSDWAGRNIYVDFGGARYDPTLYVDGKLAGSQFDGFDPFRCNITTFVHPGQTSVLALRCEDISALYPPNFTDVGFASQQGSLLAPAGGYKNSIGLWDHVWLQSTGPQAIDATSVAIATSTRKQTITVTGSADGAPVGATVTATVIDAGKRVLTLPAAPVGADGAWAITAPFPNAHDWSPYDPHLYTMHIDLDGADGEALDTLPETFGFKEMWTEGPDIYLNGTKIHLLGSATWPLANPEPDAAIDAKVAAIRASNTICFRLHNQIWQEEWLNAADRDGLLIVDESPLYTDGAGQYAYNDPAFWTNYRDEIARMIQRDRNHASLAMYSIENEELFMNDQRFDPDLAMQIGSVGRYAKSLDPTHLITFEGDQDPDGAADVMGLHYPHEPPGNFAYPNTGDWLNKPTETEAAGGLLGRRRTSFFWTRKKPLYIGEYLWMPQNDYSDGSIFYGDAAYENLDKYHQLAQARAFYDQTISYRRAGVSGMGPWSAFGFGGSSQYPELVADEKNFYSPLAAFPADRGFRYYGGAVVHLHFDLFDDDMQPHLFHLTLRVSGGAAPLAHFTTAMTPGGYRAATLTFSAPSVHSVTEWHVAAVLRAGGKIVYTAPLTLTFYPRLPLRVPGGVRLIAYDPTGAWPGSVRTLDALSGVDPARTILLVAPDAFGSESTAVPVITDGMGASAIVPFLRRGGKAIVLDQETLAPLGLGLDVVPHASTLTFPLDPKDPILRGLPATALSDWAPDNYVSRYEIRRAGTHGFRAVTVSGGPDELAQCPIATVPFGMGYVVLMQALVGEKRAVEPAAERILQNAVDYLASMPPSNARPAVVYASAAMKQALDRLGVETADPSILPGRVSLILEGGGLNLARLKPEITAVLRSGGTVYWHTPEPASLDALAGVLGMSGASGPNHSAGIEEVTGTVGTSLSDRASPLLDGVSREDLTYQIVTTGWNASSRPDVHAASCEFLPSEQTPRKSSPTRPIPLKANGTADFGGGVTIAPVGGAQIPIPDVRPGYYVLNLKVTCSDTSTDDPALLLVEIDGVQTCWLPVSATNGSAVSCLIRLNGGAGEQIDLLAQNGRGGAIEVASPSITPQAAYPNGTQVLVNPGAAVTWSVGRGRVVLDGVDWDDNPNNIDRGARYASALLANCGFAFTAPAVGSAAQPIPLTAFSLVGPSPYFSQTPQQITLLSDGTVASKVRFERSGLYDVRIYANSSQCDGVYATAALSLDGAPAKPVTVASTASKWFDFGAQPISTGEHTIAISFTNDHSDSTGDRNLYIQGVSVSPAGK